MFDSLKQNTGQNNPCVILSALAQVGRINTPPAGLQQKDISHSFGRDGLWRLVVLRHSRCLMGLSTSHLSSSSLLCRLSLLSSLSHKAAGLPPSITSQYAGRKQMTKWLLSWGSPRKYPLMVHEGQEEIQSESPDRQAVAQFPSLPPPILSSLPSFISSFFLSFLPSSPLPPFLSSPSSSLPPLNLPHDLCFLLFYRFPSRNTMVWINQTFLSKWYWSVWSQASLLEPDLEAHV